MKNIKRPLDGLHHQHTQKPRHGTRHKRLGQNEVVRLILTAWLLIAPVAIILLYFITRDATIVLLWTSCIGLIAIVFAYFFRT